MNGLAGVPTIERRPHVYLDDARASKDWREKAQKGEADRAAILVKDWSPENVAIDVVGEVKADDGEKVRRVKYTLSNAKRDRMGDSISTAGWNLDSFHAGTGFGPVLWSHFSGMPPIGRGTAKLLKTKLVGVAEFFPEGVDPFVDEVVRMIEFKALKAASVGFDPKNFEWNEDEHAYDFKEHDLLEFSVVNVGAHPDALVAASLAGIDTDFLEQMARDQLTNLCGMGRWVEAEKLDAVVRGLGLRRAPAKLFELNPQPLEKAIKSRVSAQDVEEMDDAALTLCVSEAAAEMERRGLLTDPEADPEVKSDPPDAATRIEAAVERLAELMERQATPPEPEPKPTIRLVQSNPPDQKIPKSALVKLVRDEFQEAIEPIKAALRDATGRVI